MAEYYVKRDALIAAANRAKLVVETYPDTVETEKALEIMVNAYDTLKMPTLARQSPRPRLSMTGTKKPMPRHRFFYGCNLRAECASHDGALHAPSSSFSYLATLPATLSTSQVREKGGA